MSVVMSTQDVKDNLIVMMKIIVKKSGLVVARKTNLQLSTPQCDVMQDHFKGGTNRLYCIKQALETFALDLKETLLPSNICCHVSMMERDGIIPSKVVHVKCNTTKIGSKSNLLVMIVECSYM